MRQQSISGNFKCDICSSSGSAQGEARPAGWKKVKAEKMTNLGPMKVVYDICGGCAEDPSKDEAIKHLVLG